MGFVKSNSAPSSARVRAIRVGTGSRLRRWLGCCGTAGGGSCVTAWADRFGTELRCRRGRSVCCVRALRRFEDDLIVKPPAVGQLKLSRQHIRGVRIDLIESQWKSIGPTRAIPSQLLI